MHIGTKIRDLAAERGLNQREIAEIRGISPQAVSQEFKKESLSYKILHAYSRILNLPVDEIVKEKAEINKNQEKTTSNSIDLSSEFYRLSRENSVLWRIINQNGIKIDASQLNFNLGVSYSAFAV